MQGDTLAPFLFVITSDYDMQKAIEGREAEFNQTNPVNIILDNRGMLINNITNFNYQNINKLYKIMPKISDVIKQRGLRIAGHRARYIDELAYNLILWKPKNGIPNKGRQPKTFIDILKNDCDCE